MNPCFETATRLARAIRNGQLKSVEATEAHLRANRPAERADQRPGRGRSRWRDEGRARRRPRAGARRTPGSGRCTACRSPSRRRSTSRGCAPPPATRRSRTMSPRTDASLVARLRAAGAVILGKTNVPELCADFQTDSPLFGTTKNAWDARRTAGGSTGGGAVAVAARLSPLELGSDIGGSVRNPAHYNGIFSLKPTEWRVPGRGHVPEPARPDADRPLHGRVRPAGALGRGSRDGAAHHRRARRLRGRGRRRCRSDRRPRSRPRTCASPCSRAIRWSRSRPTRRRSCRRPCGCSRKAGAKVKRAEPEGLDWRQGWDDWCRSLPVPGPRAAAAGERERTLRDGRCVRSVGALGRRARRGSTWPSSSPCSTAATASCASASRFLDDYDAWLMPVMPDAAFIRQKQSEPLVIDGAPHPYFFAGTSYNFLANLTGQPSIVLPCGFSQGGPADRPAAHRQALGRRQAARRRQGAGEAAAALSGAAELRLTARLEINCSDSCTFGLLRGSASSARTRPSGRRRRRRAASRSGVGMSWPRSSMRLRTVGVLQGGDRRRRSAWR